MEDVRGGVAISVVLLFAMLAFSGPIGVLPHPNGGSGRLSLSTDRCSYHLGDSVTITFSNVGDADLDWPVSPIPPFDVYGENGTLVFRWNTGSARNLVLSPGESLNAAWNQTTGVAGGYPSGSALPGWYRIRSEARTVGNVTSAEVWLAIAAPCPSASITADAGPDLTVAEGQVAHLRGSGPSNWTLLPSLAVPRMDLAVASANGHVFAIGGKPYDEGNFSGRPTPIEAYDPVAGRWSVKSLYGAPVVAAATFGGKIFIFWGSGVDVYDPAANTTTFRTYMPGEWVGRWTAAAALGGRIYVVGGLRNLTTILPYLRIYDPLADTWTLGAPMPTPRYGLAAVAVGSRLYAVGGISMGPGNTVEVYDPATDTWTTAAPLPFEPTGATGAVIDGTLYVAGGDPTPDCAGESRFAAYSPDSGTWTALAPLRLPRRFFALAELGGSLYAVGGSLGFLCGNAGPIESFRPKDLAISWDVNHRFDSDGDGNRTNDADAAGLVANPVYGDDGAYVATLTLRDALGNTARDTAMVTVLNTPPTIVSIETTPGSGSDVGLRVAGRKWNRVAITLSSGDMPVGHGSVERGPESPNEQIAWIRGPFDTTATYRAVVTYEPRDLGGGEVGANPAWLVTGNSSNFTIVGHHTFNIQRSEIGNSSHWNQIDPWVVDIAGDLLDRGAAIQVVAADNGSDDLTFSWSTGGMHTYYNNESFPDPPASPSGVFPFEASDRIEIPYAPGSTIELRVSDDDGGSTVVVIAL